MHKAFFNVSILASLLVSAVPVVGQTLTKGIYNSPGQASAYGDPNSPDAMFVADGGSTKESFGVEGNVNLSAQELRVNALAGGGGGNFTFGVAKNTTFEWVAGRSYGFSQQYSGDATKQIVFTLNDTFTGASYSVSHKADFGNVGLLMIRERTPKGTETQSSSILFENMTLNGMAVAGSLGLSSGTDDDRANYATITGIDFREAWTFAGTVTMDWSGFEPKANKLNFQIKAMQTDFKVIPEPTSLALAAGATLAALLRRRRCVGA